MEATLGVGYSTPYTIKMNVFKGTVSVSLPNSVG